MKGKYHLLSGIIFLLLIFILDLLTGLNIYLLIQNTSLIIIFIILYLFFAGLLLPDADKFGSWIFKFFFPFAIISWLMGFLISFINGKKFKHRGFLHSLQGVLLTSIVSSLSLFFLMSLFLDVSFSIILIFIASTLLGQLIHLLLDFF